MGEAYLWEEIPLPEVKKNIFKYKQKHQEPETCCAKDIFWPVDS